MTATPLDRATAKMRAHGAAEAAIDVFAYYHSLAQQGESGYIREDDIAPLTDPPSLSSVAVDPEAAREALARTVIIKLNGGLGTSMGLDRAKTLLPVRDGATFLDLLVQQVRWARREYGVRLPLLFMNSFRTREDSLGYLARFDDLAVDGLPLDFLQNAEPKLVADTLEPVEWPADPALEWCPPGHGDLYTALQASGTLQALLDAGFRYASIANGDNLGAAPDATLAGWFAGTSAPYAAEVCPRTPNDRKGGHLAVRRADGQLILRDTAQTHPDEMQFFTDEFRHPFFHTNNLWVDLQQLADALAGRGSVLGLPLIRNHKTVDPADPTSPAVVQFETAMGAAIEVFPGATAIAVDRAPFLPVTTTNALLLLRSDAFEPGEDGRLSAVTERIPAVDLAKRWYGLLGDFEQRIRVTPSLRGATSLSVQGDWTFDSPVTVTGELVLPDDGRAHATSEGLPGVAG